MSKKILFPGVTQHELDKQTETEKQKQKQDYIKAIEQKYDADIERDFVSTKQLVKKLVKINSSAVILSFIITNLIWLGNNMTNKKNNYTPYQQGIKEAYWPIKKDYSTQKNKFNPTIAWIANLIVALYATKKSFAAVTNAKDKACETNKRRDAVRTMAHIKLHNTQTSDSFYIYHWNLENLLKTAQDIVAKMSCEDRVYFDMLLKDQIHARTGAQESEKCSELKQFASVVIMAHLEKHPEDVTAILNTFDNRSIPKQIMTYIDKQKSI